MNVWKQKSDFDQLFFTVTLLQNYYTHVLQIFSFLVRNNIAYLTKVNTKSWHIPLTQIQNKAFFLFLKTYSTVKLSLSLMF